MFIIIYTHDALSNEKHCWYLLQNVSNYVLMQHDILVDIQLGPKVSKTNCENAYFNITI